MLLRDCLKPLKSQLALAEGFHSGKGSQEPASWPAKTNASKTTRTTLAGTKQTGLTTRSI